MDLKTITIKEYLSRKGIAFREAGKELVTRCLFSDCDKDSTGNEAHLYFDVATRQYHCKKCGAKGNIFSLAKFFGEDDKSILLESSQTNKGANNYRTSEEVQKIWGQAVEPPLDFSYLIKKKISPLEIRFLYNKLVLPVRSSNGEISSLQFIDADGNKNFLARGRVAGCYMLIGQPETKLCIAEGYATAVSIYEATGYAVAVAYSATNLKTTARELKIKYPQVDIIVCADTDEKGYPLAKDAASAIGARLAFPKFETGAMVDGKPPTDFNDLHVLQGLTAIKSAIDLAELIPQKFQFTSLANLLNEPEEIVTWVVDDLLPSGGFSILVAKPKVGKSTIARQLALSVARGEIFLGRQTIKGRVLYVSLEEKRHEVKKHFREMAADTEDVGIYVGVAPEGAYKWLADEVTRQRPILVIVDTLFRFARVTDVSDYAKIITALDPLLALARENSAHLMVLHHARKTPGDGADVTLGSTAIFGTVDTAIILKRNNINRTLETQQRYGNDIPPTVLIFDSESRMTTLGGSKEEEDIKSLEADILEFLRLVKEPPTETMINEEVGGKTLLLRKALRNLLLQEKITRTGAGVRGNPYLYFCSLVPDIGLEQETREPKSAEKVDNIGSDSRSNDSLDSPELGNELLSPDPKENGKS